MNIFNRYNRGDYLGIEQISPKNRPLLIRREEVDIFARDPFKINSYNFHYAERPHAVSNNTQLIKLENRRRQYLNNSNRFNNKPSSAYDNYSGQFSKNNLELPKSKNFGSIASARLPKSKLSKQSCNQIIQQSRKKSQKTIAKNQTLQTSAESVPSRNFPFNKSYTKLLPNKMSSSKLLSKPPSKLSKNSIGSQCSSISKLVNIGSRNKSISSTSTKTTSSQTPGCNISLSLKGSPENLINVSPSKRTIVIHKGRLTPFNEISPYLSNNQNINNNRLNEKQNRTNLYSWTSDNKKTEMIYKNPKNNIASKSTSNKLLTTNNQNEKCVPTVQNYHFRNNKENSKYLNFEMSIELIQ